MVQLAKCGAFSWQEKKSVSGAALHDAATLAQVAAWVCSGTKDANIASAACRTVMTAAASLPTREWSPYLPLPALAEVRVKLTMGSLTSTCVR